MADNSKLDLLIETLVGLGTASGKGPQIYDTLPDNDDITVTAGTDTAGTYVEIASTVGSATVWFTGGYNSAPSAAIDFKAMYAVGAVGSTTDFATFPLARTDIGTAASAELGMYFPVCWPIRIANGTATAGGAKAGSGTPTLNFVLCFVRNIASIG
jgi:hypothetical protein